MTAKHPFLRAWLLSSALLAAAVSFALTCEDKVVHVLSAGRLDFLFASNLLLTLAMQLGPVFLLMTLMHLLAPTLNKPKAWPLADQIIRLRIERVLRRLSIWQTLLIMIALFALKFVAVNELGRHGLLPAFAGPVLGAVFLACLWFVILIRPAGRTDADLSAGESFERAHDTL